MDKLSEVVKFLSLLNPYTPRSALFLAALSRVAEVAVMNRVKGQTQHVHTADKTVPANLYALTFMPSGSGKDKPHNDIASNLMGDIYEDYEGRIGVYMDRQIERVLAEAEEKFGEKSSAAKREFIQANSPRRLAPVMADATLEGFVAMREAYATAGFGGTMLFISEFGDYITSHNNTRAEFLSILNDVYDYGDNRPKVIKGERVARSVRGVPSNAVLHTSLYGLLEDGAASAKLRTFLGRGIARRCLVCYPQMGVKIEDDPLSIFSRERDRRQLAFSMAEPLRGYFNSLYFGTHDKQCVYYDSLNTFAFTEEADEIIGIYKAENVKKYTESLGQVDEGLSAELNNRAWKAIKIAVLLAAFSHPSEKMVAAQDAQGAINICEAYGKQFAAFFTERPAAPAMKLYEFLLRRKGEWTTRMDIYQERFVSRNTTGSWLNETLPVVEEYASEQGYAIEVQRSGRWHKYRLVDKDELEVSSLAD